MQVPVESIIQLWSPVMGNHTPLAQIYMASVAQAH